MNENVNLEAAIGVLTFLGTAFLLGVATLMTLHALKTKRRQRAKKIGLAAATVLGLYLSLLVAFSFMSREKALAIGEEKHFCEIDCHVANSVLSVRKTKTLGDGPQQQAISKGIFYVVTVRTRFDETTTSATRGDGLLTPNSRILTALDGEGNSYEQSVEGQRALAASAGGGTPLYTPLRPGQSYTTELVFDLPADVKNPQLLMREGEYVTRFIIGHENSFWHEKTKFRLES
ncbi:MAG TPA: hypothetical protein VM095_10615 [Pyrinomonadaceae bacterium]|nr:hypothetical protein [Pyrinomonadaceae bacterium]